MGKLSACRKRVLKIAPRIITLVCDVETRLVLRVIAVEEEAGLVGGAKQRLGDDWSAEPVNHRAGLHVATADLEVVVDRFCGEVEELQMDPWRKTAQK